MCYLIFLTVPAAWPNGVVSSLILLGWPLYLSCPFPPVSLFKAFLLLSATSLRNEHTSLQFHFFEGLVPTRLPIMNIATTPLLALLTLHWQSPRLTFLLPLQVLCQQQHPSSPPPRQPEEPATRRGLGNYFSPEYAGVSSLFWRFYLPRLRGLSDG